MIKNICKNCGKEYEYEPKKGSYKFQYCSQECKHEYARKDSLPQWRICEHCGKKYWWDSTKKNYDGNINVDTKRFCSFECGKAYKYEKVKRNTIEKYGAIGFGVKEFREKGLITTAKKYGNSNYNNRNKAKQTNLEKYGVEHISQTKEFKESVTETWNNKTNEEIQNIIAKHIKTNQEKYNVDNVSQIEEIKNKIIKTWNDKSKEEIQNINIKRENSMLKHYNTKHYVQTDEFKNNIKEIWNNKTDKEIQEINDKRIKTNLEKYGATHFMKSKKFIEEYKQNMIEKFGIEYPYLSQKAQEKKKEICLKNFGIEASIDTISKTNIKFYKMLKNLNIKAELKFPLERYFYDLKVNDILIEINPTFTHNSSTNINVKNTNIIKKEIDYHMNKTLFANKKGYKCIHIFDWDSPYKIAQLLKSKDCLYARNLTIKEVSKNETKMFLEKYHLQSSCNGQEIRLGLYNKNDKLIELMTFGKPRYNKNFEYELLRLCTKSEYKVVGGAEKLFKHFLRIYNPKSIISYCDNSKFKGEVYLRLGMKLIDYGKPSKHWFNIFMNRHITDNLLKQRGYSQLHNDKTHKKGESNQQLMLEAGYLEVYDCGQSVYVWKK